MKKNISVISMDSVLQEWLIQKLIKEPPDSDSAKELLSGIYDMVSGEVNSLLLSTVKNPEIASLNLSDEMKIGELVINPKSRSVALADVSLHLHAQSMLHQSNFPIENATGSRLLSPSLPSVLSPVLSSPNGSSLIS